MRPRLALVLATFALLSPSCGGMGDAVDPNHCRDTYCVGGEERVVYGPYNGPSPLDLLVVLDDSIPSGPYAARLEHGLRAMAAEMPFPVSSCRRGIDLNVALVPAAMTIDSSGAGPPARLWPTNTSCPAPSGTFLHSAQLCDAPSNFQGDLADALPCAALAIPPSGQAPRPLETIRALLSPNGPGETSGFRRKNAPLFLAIIAAEDDPALASEETATEYRDFLGTVIDDIDMLTVGVVAPTTADGLVEFEKSFGANGSFNDILDDYWWALPQTTSFLICDYSPWCIDWPVVDAEPDTPGIQPDCVATEVHYSIADGAVTGRTETILARCPDNALSPDHCWQTKQDPDRCRPGELRFVVEPAQPTCWPSYAVRYSLTCAVRYD